MSIHLHLLVATFMPTPLDTNTSSVSPSCGRPTLSSDQTRSEKEPAHTARAAAGSSTQSQHTAAPAAKVAQEPSSAHEDIDQRVLPCFSLAEYVD